MLWEGIKELSVVQNQPNSIFKASSNSRMAPTMKVCPVTPWEWAEMSTFKSFYPQNNVGGGSFGSLLCPQPHAW